jgi:hypothetical protein
VGRAGDLLVKMREDLEGRWFPVIHTGYYYVGTEELYLFSERGQYTITVTTTGVASTVVITGLADDPTLLGPVILYQGDSPRPMQRVCSPLRAFRPITFSGAGTVRTATVSGLLVSLVSDPVTGIYLSVPTTGSIVSHQDYTYDPKTGTIYLRDDSPPSLYATYLVDETDTDLLRQEEILVVDTDGKVRTQFSPVSMASGYVPIIRRPTAAGTIQATGVAVSRNIITFSPSGQIPSGSVVAVQYYVDDSFTAVPSGTRLLIRHFLSNTGEHFLEYETGGEWYDLSQLSSSHANFIQLNPIVTPRQSGFLYLIDRYEGYPSVGKVRVYVSNHNPVYNPSGSAKLVIAATVYDTEGEPIPEQALTTVVSGVPGILTRVYQSEEKTDGLGQVIYAFTPHATGTARIVSTVLNGTSGTIDVRFRPIQVYQTQAEQRLGKLLLHMEEKPFRDDLFRVNAYYCYGDGTPFQADSATREWTTSVTFTSENSPLFDMNGIPLQRPISVSTNSDGIASVLTRPVPGDIIRAEVKSPTSGRIRTARPIRIPEEEQEV